MVAFYLVVVAEYTYRRLLTAKGATNLARAPEKIRVLDGHLNLTSTASIITHSIDISISIDSDSRIMSANSTIQSQIRCVFGVPIPRTSPTSSNFDIITYRHDFYQTDGTVVISVYRKGLHPGDVSVHFLPRSVGVKHAILLDVPPIDKQFCHDPASHPCGDSGDIRIGPVDGGD